MTMGWHGSNPHIHPDLTRRIGITITICPVCARLDSDCRCARCDECDQMTNDFSTERYPVHGEAHAESLTICRTCRDAWADIDIGEFLP